MFVLLALGLAHAADGSSPPPPPPPVADLGSVPASAAKRGPDHNNKPHPVLARLIADSDAVAPGSTARVGIHLTQDEHWHTYWKSPGAIGQPTVVTWTAPDGFVVGDLEFPVPQRFEQNGEVSYGYDREVLLTADLTVPADASPGAHPLTANVEWLVCNTSCIRGTAELASTVTVGSAAPSKFAPLFDHYQAQHAGTIDGFTFETVLSMSAVRPNDHFRAAFVLKPTGAPFAAVSTDVWPTFTPIATSYDWGVSDVVVRPMPDGSVVVVVDADAYEPDPIPAAQRIGGLVQLKIGDKLVRTEIDGALPWAAKDAKVASVTHPAFAIASAPPSPAAGHAGASSAVAEADPTVVAATMVPTGAETGPVALLFNLALAFVGGLILNVMPCVLPVLTLKLYGLVEQTDITASKRRATGLAYTGGVVASFWALAAMVVIARTVFGMQVGWGFQFQYPPYVAALTTVVFVFGLSLLGVFEIPVVGAETADRASSKDGLAGSFFTGVFATLLATPCSAPFLGTAIAYAFGAPTPVLLAVFTAVGLGLAAPFVLVAFVPVLFRFLPRPGAWMDTFKHVLGFTLLATTVWLVDVLVAQIGSERVVGFLAFLLAVGIGAWVYGKWGGVAETVQRQVAAFAVGAAISAGAGMWFLDLQLAEDETCDDGTVAAALSFDEEIPWQAFSEPRLAALSGKTVFIDFTADWCLSCKVQERTVLETAAVRSRMAELGIVPLKADWTRRDEVITKWLRKHGREGVPMYLVIPADPSKQTIVLPEVITPGMVVDALNGAS